MKYTELLKTKKQWRIRKHIFVAWIVMLESRPLSSLESFHRAYFEMFLLSCRDCERVKKLSNYQYFSRQLLVTWNKKCAQLVVVDCTLVTTTTFFAHEEVHSGIIKRSFYTIAAIVKVLLQLFFTCLGCSSWVLLHFLSLRHSFGGKKCKALISRFLILSLLLEGKIW